MVLLTSYVLDLFMVTVCITVGGGAVSLLPRLSCGKRKEGAGASYLAMILPPVIKEME